MKIFKNRTVLGVICIVAALVICFAVTPLFNAGLSKKTVVVRVTKEAQAGEVLTKEMLAEVEVGSFNLPQNICRKIADVEGKYLVTDIFTGDFILPEKVSEVPAAENNYLYNLDGEKQAISITIDNFAEGLSGKLMSGDIVSVIAPDFQGKGETVIPVELTYVEVIAVTAKTGYDANTETRIQPAEEEKELPATVTLLAGPLQSRLLAELESEGNIHLALVYRGTTEKAEEYLEKQENILTELFQNGELGNAAGENSAATWNMDELIGLFGTIINEDLLEGSIESGRSQVESENATDWSVATDWGADTGEETEQKNDGKPDVSRGFEKQAE